MKYHKKACIALAQPVQLLILLSEWKKHYPQVYLKECKYKSKKIKIKKFTNTQLDSESWSELEPDTESGSKFELKSNSEQQFFYSLLLMF